VPASHPADHGSDVVVAAGVDLGGAARHRRDALERALQPRRRGLPLLVERGVLRMRGAGPYGVEPRTSPVQVESSPAIEAALPRSRLLVESRWVGLTA